MSRQAGELAEQLARLDDSAGDLAGLADREKQAEAAWTQLAESITASRTKAAAGLDRAVLEELTPLKLEAARFATEIRPLAAERWSASGKEEVRFVASTNPGMPPGPIDRIASGGELARFLLALKGGLPIVPVGISGSLAVQPKGSHVVRPGPITLRYGRPIDAAEYGLRQKRELEQVVRREIARLAGLEEPAAGS